eukprot:EG_transcript_5644
MLEGYVSSILIGYLGKYVENVDRDSLHISVWSGDVCLRNVQLRRDALDSLRLPLVVDRGVLGCLRIYIPWSRVTAEPIRIHIEDLLLVAKSRKAAPWDEEVERQFAMGIRTHLLKRLEQAQEQLKTIRPDSVSGAEGSLGIMQRLRRKILTNLEVQVRNVHFRYEEAILDRHNPFALGLQFRGLSCITTDSQWEPQYVADPSAQPFSCKLLKLERFSLYMDVGPATRLLSEEVLPPEEWRAWMQGHIDGEAAPQYVLDPVDVTCKAQVQTKQPVDTAWPEMQLDVLVSDAHLYLSRQQYCSVMGWAQYFGHFETAEKYRRHRPPAKWPSAAEWWGFACQCGRLIARERLAARRFDWDQYQVWKANRTAYVQLYQRKQRGSITVAEEQMYGQLQLTLDPADVLEFRQTAQAEARPAPCDASGTASPAKPGWGAWLYAALVGSSSTTADMALMEELPADVLHDLEEGPSADPMPPEYVRTKATFTLESSVLSLVHQDSHLCDVAFTSLTVAVLLMPTRFKVITALESCEVAHKGAFPHIVRPNQTHTLQQSGLLHASLEQHPMPGVDYGLHLFSQPLDVVLHVPFFRNVSQFFGFVSNFQELGSLQKGLKYLADYAAQQLQSVLESSVTLDLQCDLQSPNFIIPEDYTNPTGPVLVLASGGLYLQSRPQDM